VPAIAATIGAAASGADASPRYAAAVDGPDLSPATRRRRPAPEPAPAAPTAPPASGELAARLAALESTTRAVDARVEALDRAQRASHERLQAALTEGFQEVASRALVLAEATDELLTRHAAALERIESGLGQLRAAVDAVASTVESTAPGRDESERRVADLTVAMARLQATVDAAVAHHHQAAEAVDDDVQALRMVGFVVEGHHRQPPQRAGQPASGKL
jgi:hypothetical protein